ncbi:MAG: mevalonate kinase [Lentisphaerae bacterium]|nr:mevalonate kinase [Lentisphaerota bacterium]
MTAPDANSTRVAARASAPGSLMLFGEHAVLHGYLAISCAINLRVTVHATRRTDGRLRVMSALGERETPLAAPDATPPFQFAVTTAAAFAEVLPGGIDVRIESEFRDDLGLGSSAAVTVATHAALDALVGQVHPHRALQERCLAIIRRVQGLGSGADAAASILGGVVAYRAEPLEMRRVAVGVPLAVAYSGAKEKTAVVVGKVERLRAAHPEAVDRIYRAMDAVAHDALSPLAARDWVRVGQLCNMGQGLMAAIGVSTPMLDRMLAELRQAPGVTGTKISGSGLGDCIVGIGSATADAVPFPLLPVSASDRGVEVAL